MAYTRLPFFVFFKFLTQALKGAITSAIIPCREKRHENIAVTVRVHLSNDRYIYRMNSKSDMVKIQIYK